MTVQQKNSSYRSVSEAILVLKKGKKDDRWYEAAEFLIERATPEVRLMLEVGQAMAERKSSSEKSVRTGALREWALYGTLLISVTAGVIWVGLKLVILGRGCA